MMWDYGQGMVWMWLWGILLLIGIAILVLLAVRIFGGGVHGGYAPPSPPMFLVGRPWEEAGRGRSSMNASLQEN